MDYEIIAAHKEDYEELISNIRSKLQSLEGMGPGDAKHIIQDLKDLMKEAEFVFQGIKLKVMSKRSSELENLVERFRVELATLKQQIAIQEEEIGRKRLIISEEDDQNMGLSNKITVVMSKTTDTLREVEKMGQETIDIADSVVTTLDQQRGQMESSRYQLTGINISIDEARHLMSSIWTKMLTTQGIKIVIIIVLIIANLSVIYVRYFYHPGTPQPEPSPTNHTPTAPSLADTTI